MLKVVRFLPQAIGVFLLACVDSGLSPVAEIASNHPADAAVGADASSVEPLAGGESSGGRGGDSVESSSGGASAGSLMLPTDSGGKASDANAGVGLFEDAGLSKDAGSAKDAELSANVDPGQPPGSHDASVAPDAACAQFQNDGGCGAVSLEPSACLEDVECPVAPSCMTPECRSGHCQVSPSAYGAPCGADDSLLCDGEGRCVACLDSADCGDAGECGLNECDLDGVCQRSFVTAHTPTATQTTADCRITECDGSGEKVDVLAPVGTPCSSGICDAAGDCVGCQSDADCENSDDLCNLEGACDLSTNVCVYARVDCGDSTACAESICNPITGDCDALPINNGMGCGETECEAPQGCVFDDTNSCSESGTNTTQCMEFSCSDGACVGAPTVEISACSRSTAGDSCGGAPTTTVSECVGSAECATEGTETVRVTSHSCAGGRCTTTFKETERFCILDTQGQSCGGEDTDPCVEGECVRETEVPVKSCRSTLGLREITCRFPRCDAGECVTTEVKSRTTCGLETAVSKQGMPCGVCELPPLTECVYDVSDLCDEAGTQNQLCSNSICDNDVCTPSDSGSPTITLSVACGHRNVDGDLCGDSGQCQGGVCVE